MAKVRRYLFDRDFGLPDEEASAADEGAAALPSPEEAPALIPEPEPEPVFTLAEIEAARREGFQQGSEQGFRDAQKTNEKSLLETTEKALASIVELFRLQEAANAQMARDALDVAVAAVRKLFPSYCARFGCDEIEGLVAEILKRLETEPKISVQVHASMVELLTPRLLDRATPLGLGDRLVVMAAEAIAPGDCLVKWTSGGAERLTAETWAEIDRILARNIQPSETAEVAAEGPSNVKAA